MNARELKDELFDELLEFWHSQELYPTTIYDLIETIILPIAKEINEQQSSNNS